MALLTGGGWPSQILKSIGPVILMPAPAALPALVPNQVLWVRSGMESLTNETTVAKSIGNQWNLSTFSDYFLALLLLSAIFASRPQ